MIAFVVAALMGIMLIHILMESIPALREVGIKMFLPSSEWRPVSAAPQYGLLPAVTGTLYVSGLAVLFAMILGVACACFLTFFMPKKLASVCLAFIDLVAGIPSVIFGFIGLTVLVKAFVKYLKMAAGQCVLVAGIVLGIGRAFGETMAVIMIAGNQAWIPDNMFQGIRTLTANIVMEMGYAQDLHREALIATGVVLFVFILIINTLFSILKRREAK